MKPPYLKKKSGIRIVVDYWDTRFSRISSRKQKDPLEAVLAYGTQVESFKQNNNQKSPDTVPLIYATGRMPYLEEKWDRFEKKKI